MTTAEELKLNASNKLNKAPIISTINNIKIAATGQDLLGYYAVSEGERHEAKMNAIFDVGLSAVGGSGASYGIKTGASYVDNIVENIDEGIVYLRTNLITGKQYVGQAKSAARYEARQLEHARANKDAEYIFEEIGKATPGKALDILEQKMINKYGGLEKNGGLLENKRNQIRFDLWEVLGIK